MEPSAAPYAPKQKHSRKGKLGVQNWITFPKKWNYFFGIFDIYGFNFEKSIKNIPDMAQDGWRMRTFWRLFCFVQENKKK